VVAAEMVGPVTNVSGLPFVGKRFPFERIVTSYDVPGNKFFILALCVIYLFDFPVISRSSNAVIFAFVFDVRITPPDVGATVCHIILHAVSLILVTKTFFGSSEGVAIERQDVICWTNTLIAPIAKKRINKAKSVGIFFGVVIITH